ncbi:MAG: ABC transporter ATPase, partial [Bacteroidota bacterium]
MYVPLEDMSPESRVWVYMCDRTLEEGEVEQISFAIRPFLDEWTAHQRTLKSSYAIIYNRFLIIAVDEAMNVASGCSIDKSVSFIKSVEQRLNCNFMNRMLFAYKKGETVVVAEKEEFERLADAGLISDDTLVFDNLVDSVHALNHRWE